MNTGRSISGLIVEAYETYVGGEVFQSILNDPTLRDVKSKDFEVFDDLTALTHPGMTIA